MPKKPEIVRIPRDQRLRESPRQSTSMSIPLAVHHHLDLLAEAASDTDATRAEIVAMLIADTELDPEQLESAVMRYRKLNVGDLLDISPSPSEQPDQLLDEDKVVSITKRSPGRPRRESS